MMDAPAVRWRVPVLVVLGSLMLGLRLAAPVDVVAGDQEKQVGYVMDLLHGAAWSIQYEVNGEVATKPPLYNWLAWVVCRVFDTADIWAIKLPGLVAAIGLAVLIHRLARWWFNDAVAFWACAAFIASTHVAKFVWWARTDMLMVFTVYVSIVMVIALPSRWWKWPVIGVMVGLSFLAKGPVGPLLVVLWLLLWVWWNGSWRDIKAWKQILSAGLVAAVISGAWLICVWDQPGFRENVLQHELAKRVPGFEPVLSEADPIWYYIPLIMARIAPWWVLALVGWWLARDTKYVLPVRKLGVWALTFFVFFSLIPAKRHDLLLPVYPPIFILAGFGMVQLLTRGKVGHWKLPTALAVVVTLIVLNGIFCAWVRNNTEGAMYRQIETTVAPARVALREGRVNVLGARPLVSYALRLHQRGLTTSQVIDAARQRNVIVVTSDVNVIDALRDAGMTMRTVAQEAFGERLLGVYEVEVARSPIE